MHELGIATEVHRLCRARLARLGAVRLERVTLRVGELAAVETDLLRYAWEAAVAGGPDAAAVLEVEWCPARQVCDACGTAMARAAHAWIPSCPRCGGPLRIEGGQELDLLEFSYAPLAAAFEEVRR
jgi:hydrogenase nickel incorporation protein HypA/HybF